MKIQISDTMKSALRARCGQMYTVKERGEIDIYVSLFSFLIIVLFINSSFYVYYRCAVKLPLLKVCDENLQCSLFTIFVTFVNTVHCGGIII